MAYRGMDHDKPVSEAWADIGAVSLCLREQPRYHEDKNKIALVLQA